MEKANKNSRGIDPFGFERYAVLSYICEYFYNIFFVGKDIIGLAETGSGKTGSFAIPIIQSLLESPQRIYALVLTPTRELAFQISEQFTALGSNIGLKCGMESFL